MTEPFDIAFLNGRFGALSSLSLPVLDRGFLFGDAVYEVVPVYDGRVFRGDSHFDRLQHSLDGIRLDNPLRREDWNELLANVIQRNGAGSMAVYLQISRGAGSGRDHRIKPGLAPTVFAMAMPLADRSAARKKGVAAITADDIRWARCDIKSTALLANVLLASDAGRAGAEPALVCRGIEVRFGRVTALRDLDLEDAKDHLLEVLFDGRILKVLHAARQDLEIFWHDWHQFPLPLFDTQPAAALLGYGDQLGYAALTEAVLGKQVDKGHARTDWSRRPLSAA